MRCAASAFRRSAQRPSFRRSAYPGKAARSSAGPTYRLAKRQNCASAGGMTRMQADPVRRPILRGELMPASCPSVIGRSEEHTSELQSLMRISYAVFCLKKKKKKTQHRNTVMYEQKEITI